jgi:hypothetical protein
MRFYTQSYTFVFENPAQYPAIRPYELQQIRERSAGGTIHVETFAAPLQRRILNFDQMSEADYLGLLDFWVNRVNGMEDEFQFEDERGDVFTVRFLDNKLNFTESNYKRWSGQVNLEVVQ